MQAAHIMTTEVITIGPDTTVQEIANLLLNNRISAVPVVDENKLLLGIVSEGDLIRRVESDTEARSSWWLKALTSTQKKARDYVKSHGKKASDVMTSGVITVREETPLHEIARILEQKHIKRVPVTRDDKLVGIVSRANLLHGLVAGGKDLSTTASSEDQTMRDSLMDTLFNEIGLQTINVVVQDGEVEMWGIVNSEVEKQAAQVAAENLSGVKKVENNLTESAAIKYQGV